MKKCPRCKEELSPADIGPVEVDQCPECKGVWFDKDELRRAKDATDADLHWMEFEIWKHEDQYEHSTSDLSCPVCDKTMVTLQYGHTKVNVDYCPSCRGTWLEKGEFKKIVNALEDELAEKSFADYVKESVREAGEIFTGHESFISEWKDFVRVLRLMQMRLFVENPRLLQAAEDLQRFGPH